MAKNITYLLGAGASCGVIPTIADFKNADFKNDFNSFLEKVDQIKSNPNGKIDNFTLKALGKFEKINSEIQNHHTPDTLAKKLFIREKSKKNAPSEFNLNELKFFLTCYFTYKQFENITIKKKDPRYDVFWATLMDLELASLPNNVKILTWNYDIQLELSYWDFYPDLDFGDIFGKIKSNPFAKVNDPSIVKLNGTVGLSLNTYKDANEPTQILLPSNEHKSDPLVNIITYYFSDNTIQLFKFAWEEDPTKLLEDAKTISDATDILVVIGYSFPTFNRESDIKILSNKIFEKVYIQDKNKESGIRLIDKFKSINGNATDIKNIEAIESNEFYIPFEFNNPDLGPNLKILWGD